MVSKSVVFVISVMILSEKMLLLLLFLLFCIGVDRITLMKGVHIKLDLHTMQGQNKKDSDTYALLFQNKTKPNITTK